MNLKVNIKTRIRFNGKEYSCLEDMPPQVRQAYEKALASAQASGTGLISHTTSKLIFNGHEYASVDEMPADIRRMYEQVMTMVDSNQNGIPDALEPGQPASGQPELSGSQPLVAALPEANQPRPRFSRATIIGISLVILVMVLVALVVINLASRSLLR